MDKKRAVIVGASSGIGRELAKILSREGYIVGVTARREHLLQSLTQEINGASFIKPMDVSLPEEAIKSLQELVDEMGGLDLLIISAGTGYINPELNWGKEKQTIAVNVVGFVAIATMAMNYFLRQGSGHLVGMSSIAALRGSSNASAYNASKAFMSNYLEGLRFKVSRLKASITVTDIQPGFVDTEMAKGEGLFWVVPVDKAAEQIYVAIKNKRKHAYVSKRWRLFAVVLKIMPNWVCEKVL
ncbi:MAG: SDR family NAD(P)-dependent oxidoreductase [Candidatus Omnitrophota bacterium]|jgi:short-subunit dehydrogenase